jgi:uncharacterized protein (DUF983 family)
MFEGLPCLRCGETECVSLEFSNETFNCSNCETEVTFAEVDDKLAQWGVVLSWARSAPSLPDLTA